MVELPKRRIILLECTGGWLGPYKGAFGGPVSTAASYSVQSTDRGTRNGSVASEMYTLSTSICSSSKLPMVPSQRGRG
jgi:hypothetical protein